MGNRILVGAFILIILYSCESDTITSCGPGCTCSINEPCTVNCIGNEKCAGTQINGGDATDVTIICDGKAACKEAGIDCQNANSCDIHCGPQGYLNCKNVTRLSCGYSKCTLHCDGSDSCEGISVPEIDNALSFECIGNGCPEWMDSLAFTEAPTYDPTHSPTIEPTTNPTTIPTSSTINPTLDPTKDPTSDPTTNPTEIPTIDPTQQPTSPTIDPTMDPTIEPTIDPTIQPTVDPTMDPTTQPTTLPTIIPTTNPSTIPTIHPTTDPTADPTINPTINPTIYPTMEPTIFPTIYPTKAPTSDPTVFIQLDLPSTTTSTSSTNPPLTTIASRVDTITPTDSNIQYVHVKQNTNDNTAIIASFVSLFWVIVFLCAGLIYLKYKHRNRLPSTKLKPVPVPSNDMHVNNDDKMNLEHNIINTNDNEGKAAMIELMSIVQRAVDSDDDGNDTGDEMYEGHGHVTRGGNDDDHHHVYNMPSDSLDDIQNDITNGLYFAMASVSPKTPIQQNEYENGNQNQNQNQNQNVNNLSIHINNNKKQIHTSPQSFMADVIPLPASLTNQNVLLDFDQSVYMNIGNAAGGGLPKLDAGYEEEEDEYID